MILKTLIAGAAVIMASCLAVASGAPAQSNAVKQFCRPSSFDYVVLASMADSPNLPALSGYHRPAKH